MCDSCACKASAFSGNGFDYQGTYYQAACYQCEFCRRMRAISWNWLRSGERAVGE